jgi:hypothetical protein
MENNAAQWPPARKDGTSIPCFRACETTVLITDARAVVPLLLASDDMAEPVTISTDNRMALSVFICGMNPTPVCCPM